MSDRAHPCNARRGGSAGDPGRGSAAESHRADRDPAAEVSAARGQSATIAMRRFGERSLNDRCGEQAGIRLMAWGVRSHVRCRQLCSSLNSSKFLNDNRLGHFPWQGMVWVLLIAGAAAVLLIAALGISIRHQARRLWLPKNATDWTATIGWLLTVIGFSGALLLGALDCAKIGDRPRFL